MSCPYYCYPCPPCSTPCYPPCCKLCYVPYLVCYNPCCPAKTCAPAHPPKKTRKISDFANTGPSEATKKKEPKKKGKEAKNIKGKEEKRTQGTKKTTAKKAVAKKSGGGAGVKKEKVRTAGEANIEERGGGEDRIGTAPVNFVGNPVEVKNDGDKRRPATMGDVPNKRVAKAEEVIENRGKEPPGIKEGAGDSAPARRVICKCFAKQQNAAPVCRCTPKPQYKCTPKSVCQCVHKLQEAAVCSPRAMQFGTPCVYPRYATVPCAGNRPARNIIPTCTPRLQSLQITPCTLNKVRQPGAAQVCHPKGGYTFPFPGDGLLRGKVVSKTPKQQGAPMPHSLQSKLMSGFFSHPEDSLFSPRIAQKYVPKSEGAPSLRNEARQRTAAPICSNKGYNKVPFGGDGITSTRQPNAPILPLRDKTQRPQTSQKYYDVKCTTSPFEYVRTICGTCGSIKIKPKFPVRPEKIQDCYFKGSFSIR